MNQKITVLVVLLTAFITSFTGSALNLAIPDISEYYNASASLSGWIVTGYTLTVAAVSIPSGYIADRIGRKRILVSGLAAFTAASAAAVFSDSIMMLILSRAFQGIGAAMIFSTNTAILAESFGGAYRGSVLGYALAATYVGLSAGPFLGGIINYNLGWRTIFAITGSVTLVTLLLAVRGVLSDTGRRSRVYSSGRRPSASLSLMHDFAGSDCILHNSLGNGFRRHEFSCNGQPRKFINLQIIKGNRPFICSSLAALLNYGATFTVSYLLSIYLQVVLGYSSQTAGVILLVQPIIISILSPLAGKVSDSVSPFRLSAIGMAMCAAGIGAGLLLSDRGMRWLNTWGLAELVSELTETVHRQLAIPVADTPLPLQLIIILVVLSIVGAGSAFFSSPNTNAVLSTVNPEDYSFASSVLSTMRALGNTLGMFLINIVSNIYIGNTVLKQAGAQMIIQTMTIVLIISASFCLAGILLAGIKSKR